MDTMRALLRFLKPPTCSYKGGCKEISGSKMLVMTLNYLGSQTSVKHLAQQFGVTTSIYDAIPKHAFCQKIFLLLLIEIFPMLLEPLMDVM